MYARTDVFNSKLMNCFVKQDTPQSHLSDESQIHDTKLLFLICKYMKTKPSKYKNFYK